ncbi:MAG: TldD/PmbA family protein [Clostridia bacterium]|nr:TldD/PmbA family protein [Clostridia bacterium]
MKKTALDTLLNVLKTSGADAWEVADEEEKGWEFYFIRHSLDQHRAKDVRTFNVKVYKKFDDCLGSASASIPSDATEEEMRRAVEGLCSDASYVRNPFYTLNKPCQAETKGQAENIDLEAISGDFIRTLASIPETVTEDLNSYEIYVNKITRHFLNSEGIDVTTVHPSSMVEAVINARKDGHEIELYRMLKAGTCDREQLTRELKETLTYGRDRLITVPTPALDKPDVVFATDPSVELYRFFASKLYASMVYRGMSDWKIGDMVAPENLTMCSVRSLPNSSRNVAYDEEGAPIRDLTLIDHGKAVSYMGGRQFSQYLGMESSFIPSNIEVIGGTESEADLRTGDFLEVVEFSDFQVDSITGDIAGEIRLAYLHQGGKVTPVCGGSVSGSFPELLKTMRFSKESRQYNTMLIPSVTRLQGVTVTGVDNA